MTLIRFIRIGCLRLLDYRYTTGSPWNVRAVYDVHYHATNLEDATILKYCQRISDIELIYSYTYTWRITTVKI